MESPRSRGRPPVYQRESLLEAAALAVATRGYDRLRFQDVAATAGVPSASLRHYFPAIEGLRKEALRFQVTGELDNIRGELEGLTSPWDKLLRIITFTVSLEPEWRRVGWVVWLEYWRACAHDPELAEESHAYLAAWEGLIQECIEDGLARDEFELDCSPAEAARELMCAIDGNAPRLALDHTDEDAVAVIDMVERAARRLLRPRGGLPPHPRVP